ncbi:MAG TPA: 16S rRNA (cytosine(1402)-N(4))-methyltransferase RsmH, partial [Acidiferrobacteraceae bacterium]|nr:16S rRNA (cytosine(1402)-N(4))-methyltransferase RsmH [Acidiferrobacteraceae bacterium]HEX20276.1 16S rRNA (cytosine(1402)-N(4))-methyltransferase RsmH [Acidiferrobacteraceae bacterium]
MGSDEQHKAVLLEEVLVALNIKTNGNYIDATFGRGGHARAILSRLDSHGQLLALDRDPQAISAAAELSSDPRFHIEQSPFSGIASVASKYGLLGKVDGILFDLGVSSPQLDTAERGFSFQHDGPLDMRMDCKSGQSAAQWLASADEKEIANVIKTYGEERFAKRIARRIVQTREEQEIDTTAKLAAIVSQAIPKYEPGKHPATRTFQ